MKAEISYGKWQIPVYRTYANPLTGLAPIPESSFTGRSNIIFSAEVGIEVFGDNFMRAYTHGDNRNVVATDTMKNFVLQQTLDFGGSTLEEYAYFLGQKFLETYEQMHRLEITAKEQPYEAVTVPSKDITTNSEVLFNRSRNSYSLTKLEMERDDTGGIRVISHKCGLKELQLIKVTGSAFASFARDQYTTLPERTDRPLFIYLDVYWKYAGAVKMLDPTHAQYIPAEQVCDLVQVTFDGFVSMSIQHLIHEMGTRLFERFPQMGEVSFDAQNRLWDTAYESDVNNRVKVYTDPRPPYGILKLRLVNAE